MHFHYMTMHEHKNPRAGVMKLTILVDHYFILSLYDLCLGVEKTFFLNDAFLIYDLYGHAPAQEPLPLG